MVDSNGNEILKCRSLDHHHRTQPDGRCHPRHNFCRLKANANSGKTPGGWADAQKPRYGIPQVQQPQALLIGSKRDVCALWNFADVLEVAHEAFFHMHALRQAVCLRHRGKAPSYDRTLLSLHLASSSRLDPYSCALAQLNGRSFSAIPFVSSVSSGNVGFAVSSNPKSLV